jgi:DNA processing protein
MSSACEGCLRRAWLIGRLAPRIAGLLQRREGRPAGILALGDDELIEAAAGRQAQEHRLFLEQFDPERARRAVEAARLYAVCRHDPRYPASLSQLADPPAVLFSTAEPRALARLTGEPAVALVGARSASPYGLEMASRLGRGLAAAGVTVVSGLALGVDAASHGGCLDGGGRALAVLAGAADLPYPHRNRRLYERLRREGAVVSEMPPGQRAFRWSFPARNRLMAGLARMTVVVEAADPSGSLITAHFACELGRPVGAVPGRATSRLTAGVHALLRDGARLVAGPEDVLEELFGAGAPCVPEAVSDELPQELRAALDAVEAGAGVAGVARMTGLSAAEARAALARLEALGRVRRTGLGSYSPAAPRTAPVGSAATSDA